MAGKLALIEIPRPGARQAPQGLGQGRQGQILRDRAAARQRGQALRQEEPPRRLEEGQIGAGDGDGQRPIPIQQHPLLGQRDGGLQQGRPGQPAETLMGEADALDIGRQGDRFRPDHIAVLDHPRPAEEVLIALGPRQQLIARGIQGRGCHQAEVDDLGGAVRRLHHHEAAAAEPAHPGLHRPHREARGDGRIHRIAARRQDRGAGRGRAPALAGDDPGRAGNGRLAADPKVRWRSWMDGLFVAGVRCEDAGIMDWQFL